MGKTAHKTSVLGIKLLYEVANLFLFCIAHLIRRWLFLCYELPGDMALRYLLTHCVQVTIAIDKKFLKEAGIHAKDKATKPARKG